MAENATPTPKTNRFRKTLLFLLPSILLTASSALAQDPPLPSADVDPFADDANAPVKPTRPPNRADAEATLKEALNVRETAPGRFTVGSVTANTILAPEIDAITVIGSSPACASISTVTVWVVWHPAKSAAVSTRAVINVRAMSASQGPFSAAGPSRRWP